MSNKSGRFHYMTLEDENAMRSEILDELREENARLRTINAEISRLRAINAELVEALEGFEAWWNGAFPRALIAAGVTGVESGPATQAMLDAIRAAIAKANP